MNSEFRRSEHKHLSMLLCYLSFVLFFFVFYRDVIFYQGLIWGVDFQLPTSPWWTPGLSFWSPWQEFLLGSPSFIGWGALIGFVLLLISGGNAILCEKLFFCGILVANCTMFFFLTNHVTKSKWGAYAGAIIYAYSPMTQSNYGTGLVWGVAMIPLLFNSCLNLLQPSRKIKDVFLCAVYLSFLAAFSPHIMPLFPVIVLFLIVMDGRWRLIPGRITKFLGVVAVFLLINLSAFFIDVTAGSTSLAPPLVTVGEFVRNYEAFNVPNALKLTLLVGLSNPVSDFLASRPEGYLLPLMVFSPILVAYNRSTRLRTLVFVFGIISIDLLGFAIRREASLVAFLLPIYRPLIAMRGPHSLQFYLSFLYGALIALLVECMNRHAFTALEGMRMGGWSILKRWTKISRSHVLALLIIVMVLLAYFVYVPAYSPQLHDMTPAFPFPPQYGPILGFLQNDPSGSSYRYMWLPWTPTSGTIFGSMYLPSDFTIGAGSTPQAFDYVNWIYSEIVQNGTQNLGALLSPGGVKYIVLVLNSTVPADSASTMQGTPRVSARRLIGDPRQFELFLSSQTDLTLQNRTSNYEIYRNNRFSPLVTLSDDTIFVIGGLGAVDSITRLPHYSEVKPILILSDNRTMFNEEYGSAIYIHNVAADLSGPFDNNTRWMLDYDQSWLNKTIQQSQTPFTATMSLDGWSALSTQSIRLLDDGVLVEGLVQPDPVHDYAVVSCTYRATAGNWHPYDDLRLSVKPSDSKLAVVFWGYGPSNKAYVASNYEFDVRPNQWNTIEVPLNRADSSNAKQIQIIMLTPKEPNRIGSMQINGMELLNGTTSYSRMIQIPISGNFSTAVHFSGNIDPSSISLSIDGKGIRTKSFENWLESNSEFLNSGVHRVTVRMDSLDQPFSEILIHNGKSVDELLRLESQVPSLEWVRSSETEYLVHIDTNRPTFISLSESYDPHWNAYVNDIPLSHFVSFSFANGFYLNSSFVGDIAIRYEPNTAVAIKRSVSIITMALAISAPVTEFILNMLRKRYKFPKEVSARQ